LVRTAPEVALLSGHASHDVLPSSSEIVFTPHAVHDWSLHWLPAKQNVHEVQKDEPAALLKVSAGHTVHTPLAHLEPAGHVPQLVQASVVAVPSRL
jgi:hypothetical protein